MASSIFSTEQRISKPLRALAVRAGRRRKKTRANQTVWREARVDRKCNAGPPRCGSETKSIVYNSRKSRALIARANSYIILYKIGDGENVVTELTRQHLDRTTTPRASES